MIEKSDHDKFARAVLWHLSNLEVSVNQLQARVIGMTHDENQASALVETQAAGQQIRKLAEIVYQNALKKADIPSSPEYPPPYSGNGNHRA